MNTVFQRASEVIRSIHAVDKYDPLMKGKP